MSALGGKCYGQVVRFSAVSPGSKRGNYGYAARFSVVFPDSECGDSYETRKMG